MWTDVGQLSVFAVSTTPNTGLRARLAIPVLKAREVTSKIAAPVVSEPVPAVVGTRNRSGHIEEERTGLYSPAMRGRKVWEMGSPFPTGALTKSMRSLSL